MNFGKLLKNININNKYILRYYFIIGTLVIIIIFVTYVFSFQRQATREARIVPDLISHFMYYAGHDNFEIILMGYILNEIIANIDYPIIITDAEHTPVFWTNVGIDDFASWDNLSQSEKNSTLRRLERMKRKDNVIPLFHPEEGIILGYTYFEDSKIIRRLKILPYIEMVFIVFFISFGVYGLSLVRKNEKRILWAGLAKETAHQFGTPISSLIGWTDYMKVKLEDNSQRDELIPMLDDMASDINLLKKVASRFGKVGSKVQLQPICINNLLDANVNYFTKRLPYFNNEINISHRAKHKNVILMLDEELILWAFENLVKNCIDAMIHKSGKIVFTSYKKDNKFYILVKDNGSGMPKSMFSKIFEPGITTKSRGWGLGLSLTKRIIEEYHKGKIRVLESTVNKGTTFEIVLQINPEKERFSLLKKYLNLK